MLMHKEYEVTKKNKEINNTTFEQKKQIVKLLNQLNDNQTNRLYNYMLGLFGNK